MTCFSCQLFSIKFDCLVGTIAKGAALLHQEGAREVYACTTHAVFRYNVCYINRLFLLMVCCETLLWWHFVVNMQQGPIINWLFSLKFWLSSLFHILAYTGEKKSVDASCFKHPFTQKNLHTNRNGFRIVEKLNTNEYKLFKDFREAWTLPQQSEFPLITG